METTTQESRPKISVVIASVNGAGHVDDCLKSLANQTVKGVDEVIITDCCGDGVTELIRTKYPQPNIRLFSYTERKTIPELRAIGMKEARGDIIAITEDHCVAEPHWYERMLRAHAEHYGAIGGAVENDASITGIIDWAVYFCEYSAFLNPVPTGETNDIPGNNTSYRREFLEHIRDMLDAGNFWEGFLNGRLMEKGIKVYSFPEIIVYHKKVFGFRYFLSQRYHYGRSYAGMRVENAPFWKKLAYAGFCPLLPALLIGRIGYRVLVKKRYLGKFFASFPFLVIFSLAWAWGEFVGYLFGPGDSLLKVE